MAKEITVPRLGWTMEEGTFVGWLKKAGEQVRAGEPLFTLDGDKALQDIEAVDSGILQIPPDAPAPGRTVRVGERLGYLVGPDEASSPAHPLAAASVAPVDEVAVATSAPVETSSAVRVPLPESLGRISGSVMHVERRAITPRARRKAMELQVDWRTIKGTGRGGRIRERDVAAAQTSSGPPPLSSGRVVITDWTFPDLDTESDLLRAAGHEVIPRRCQTEAELVELVREADGVITQFARLNATVIGAMSRARAIIRYGIGVDNVDLAAARRAGIPVCNVPDYCIHEVADHTLALLLGLTRQVVSHTKRLRDGQWGLAAPLTEMRALQHLTVGVIGFGRIGREVVRRLLPFRCRILVLDPNVSASSIVGAGVEPAAWDEVLARADVLTLHCPSTPDTRNLLSREALSRMKRGALLINVARGDLVDSNALVQALENGQLAGAALDVFAVEPIPAGHPLLKMPNVILTPHIASASPTAVRKLRETVANLAVTALRGELPPNVVNDVNCPRFEN